MKVHCRDVKNIPMTEQVCQLYKEEQVGKVRNGKKAISDNKMPDLGWDTTKELEVQEISQVEHTVPMLPETIIAVIILIVTFLENIKDYLQKIPQAVKSMTKAVGRNKLYKRTSEICRKTVYVITSATKTTHHNSHSYPSRITHETTSPHAKQAQQAKSPWRV